MNGTMLQDRIYAGYKKDALHTGYLYDIYRADSPISPIDPSNLTGATHCRFAALVEKKPHQFKIPNYTLFADGRVLAPRDILVGQEGTFFVGDMQHLLPMQAIKCNDSIGIARPEYQGTIIVETPVAVGVPCFRQLKKIEQKPLPQIGASTTAATPVGEFFAYLPVVWTLLQQGDIVSDSLGRRYTISTIDPTELGTVLVIRQADTQT